MLRIRSLGRVSFPEANDVQHSLLNAADDYLLLFEHPPTYTRGIRTTDQSFRRSVDNSTAIVVDADRGGDVTFHGPGQLVAWYIRTVADDPSAGRHHVAMLEDVITAAVLRVAAPGSLGDVGSMDGYPGVWAHRTTRPVKIAQVGVRTERDARGRRRTLHGIAVNVSVDLAYFDEIVPCGIAEFPVGSLQSLGVAISDREFEDVVRDEFLQRVSAASVAAVDHATASVTSERPLIRRMRKAGVDLESALPVATRKPEWLRLPAVMGEEYIRLRQMTSDLSLVTVCEEAGCPNIYECWADGTATFMVNGERCTRNCGFCLVDTRKPLALDPSEPERVAEAVARLQLAHAVVTCVARDDLDDGGAGAIANTITAIRERCPDTHVEVLISDCRGDRRSQQIIFDATPDVLNHNIETVARLQRAVRPSAGYLRSLAVLARAKAEGLTTKSGMMVGLGETIDEVHETLIDLAAVGVDIVTIGQYLRPTAQHLPVMRWWTPEEFESLAAFGRHVGIGFVQSSPLTRSSYHARAAAHEASPVTLRSR